MKVHDAKVSGGQAQTMLPVFNYHGLEARAGEYAWHEEERPYVVRVLAFNEQISLLAEKGFYSLALSDLEPWIRGERLGKACMLTFDDGLKSHFDHAFSALKKKGLRGIFFVPAGLVG